jgi:hypothetical protein
MVALFSVIAGWLKTLPTRQRKRAPQRFSELTPTQALSSLLRDLKQLVTATPRALAARM